jgi:L-ascorbate metabolism protein UlaG (beta-lactamase superfamily)
LEEDSTGKQVDIHQDVENVGYLIALGGYHVLHSGDASSKLPSVFSEYGLSTEPLDVAFLDRSFMGKEGIQILNDDIHTRRIVFMHVEPAKTSYYASVIKDISIFYVFQNLLETMVFH